MPHHIDVTATVSPSVAVSNDNPSRWGAALLYGQTWDYADTAALQAANKFFCLPAPDNDRGDHLAELITTDPTFGKCVRITHRYNDDDSSASGGDSPRHLSSDFSKYDVWARCRFKYYPGYTTSGLYPAQASASWKQIFMSVGVSRFEFELLGAKWFCGYVPTDAGTLSGPTVLSEPQALGECQDLNLSTTFDAMNNAQWFETIQHYVSYNGNLNARWRWWCRQLTVANVKVDNGWYFTGRERSTSGAFQPVLNMQYGVNRNKTSPADALSSTAYSGSGSGGPFKGVHTYWGQLEVVDGALEADPYGVADWGL